jgi:hypothetical protein
MWLQMPLRLLQTNDCMEHMPMHIEYTQGVTLLLICFRDILSNFVIT